MITLNSFWFQTLGTSMLASVLVGIVMAAMWLFTGLSDGSWKKKLLISSLIMISVGISSFIYTDFITGKSAVVDDNGIVQTFPENTVMWSWKWQSLLKTPGAHLAYYGEQRFARVTMETHPITENPKVRSLIIAVSVKTGATVEDLTKLEKTTGPAPSCAGTMHTAAYIPLQRQVKSLLFEFNEKHSKELALFYNPLNQEQQAGFKKIVGDYFREPLAEAGAYLEDASFDISD